MLKGFQKIIEERIKGAQRKGEFDNLPGSGKPLNLEDDRFVPEDLRLAFKILKNADCVPPEIELKKEIEQLEAMMSKMDGAARKYKLLKKLNFLIMKLNLNRNTSAEFEMPQQYETKLVERFESKKSNHRNNKG
jgi:hypothetical protein